MSYRPLGNLCQAQGGAPFQSGTTPVTKTVLLSNFGGVSYGARIDPFDAKSGYRCDGYSTAKNAYSNQMNPYASAMCRAK